MAGKSAYWTSPRRDGGWSVKHNGNGKVKSVHNTKFEAWKETRRLARGTGSEAFLKGRDGKIRARNTYGDEPFRRVCLRHSRSLTESFSGSCEEIIIKSHV